MNDQIEAKLLELQRDFTEVRQRPFKHFYCPVLCRDDDVPLCKGHLLNRAFRNTSRAWTVQRSDVDNFYGSHFESEFVLIQDTHQHSPEEVLIDKELSRRFNPQIFINNKPVDHFVAPASFPENFTRFDIDTGEQVIRYGLKINPEDALGAAKMKWEIGLSKDLRVPVLVSVIKAAHLILFDILGYRYVFSTPGQFIGVRTLGEFFVQNQGKTKAEVLQNALQFFRNYAHMMRPVLSSWHAFQGTMVDKKVLFCGQNEVIWACIVFIKISHQLLCVLMPTLINAHAIGAYTDFMSNTDGTLHVVLGMYDHDNRRWLLGKDKTSLMWPKDGILYP